ncbi:TIGR02186 family protein [Marivivens marinus]|uniref:TIGR02186 family protein n=1 Tax=Marivivens marinus TaxID=3110173 RepID=UPI003B848FBC
MARLLVFLLLLALPAQAERVVLGLSQDEVAITANFTGSEILIFGAVRRETPMPSDSTLGVIVTVSGPSLPVTVRRKERRLGIWVNTDAVEVDAAPSFYAVATSAPLEDILTHVEDLRHSVSIPRAIRSVGADISGTEDFTEALIRIRAASDSYQLLQGAVDLEEQTLFRTEVVLPANLTEGDYATRIFLTRNGRVIDEYQTVIPVNKVGLERWLYELSRDNAPVYGVMALLIAILAGWGASAAFALLRR